MLLEVELKCQLLIPERLLWRSGDVLCQMTGWMGEVKERVVLTLRNTWKGSINHSHGNYFYYSTNETYTLFCVGYLYIRFYHCGSTILIWKRNHPSQSILKLHECFFHKSCCRDKWYLKWRHILKSHFIKCYNLR